MVVRDGPCLPTKHNITDPPSTVGSPSQVGPRLRSGSFSTPVTPTPRHVHHYRTGNGVLPPSPYSRPVLVIPVSPQPTGTSEVPTWRSRTFWLSPSNPSRDVRNTETLTPETPDPPPPRTPSSYRRDETPGVPSVTVQGSFVRPDDSVSERPKVLGK